MKIGGESLLKRLRNYYANLRIKYKMFLLTSIVLFTFSVGGLSILQYAFHTYNNEIYRQSAQLLQVTSNSIENELKKMERLSFQVATDPYVQSYLINLNKSESDYERYLIGMNLRKRLLDIGALNKYVDSIQVYDLGNKEYSSGNHMLQLNNKRLQRIKEKAATVNGGIQWIFPDQSDSTLIASREVRSYLSFSLDRIGMIAVRVNIEEIVSEFTSNLNNEKTRFVILDENEEQIYPAELSKYDEYKSNSKSSKGYTLMEDGGNRYFITHSPAKQKDWTYMIVTPFSSMFDAISSVRKAVLITYTCLFIMMIYLGARFTGNITGPIESLNRKMKRVRTGDFDYFDVEDDGKLAKDEPGQMHENFKKMMDQINYLIAENYKKQLVIKDSEFKTLQAQVNPHFLYNTLESINWSAKMVGHQQISRMAESLGYILRSSINMKQSVITLEEELEIVENYLTIQTYRFEERLIVDKHIPDDLLHSKVPKFVLQPLVENSIKYGLQRMIGTCTITIIAKIYGNQIVITVKDDGPGMAKEFLNRFIHGDYDAQGTGIGLRNIEERIHILFGEHYGLEIESELDKGTEVHIILPYEGG